MCIKKKIVKIKKLIYFSNSGENKQILGDALTLCICVSEIFFFFLILSIFNTYRIHTHRKR